MKPVYVPTAFLAWCLLVVPSEAAEISAGISIGSDGIESFHFAIADHYRVPRSTVVAVRAKKIPDDELPVVFFFAERARVSPEAIVELRLGGKSWMEIGLRFGIPAEVFYVEVEGDHGPPYGRALGHFRNRERARWSEIRLSDEDIVCLVQLKFLAARHGCSPIDVIRARASGENLLALHGKLEAKARAAKEAKERAGGGAGAEKGQGASEEAKGKAAGGGGKSERGGGKAAGAGSRGGGRGGKR